MPSKDIINYLDSLGFIDSTHIRYELGQIDIDSINSYPIIKNDGIKTVNYFICVNKPNKIKRKITVPAYYSTDKLLKKIYCKCQK
jgi:hypothetical protein